MVVVFVKLNFLDTLSLLPLFRRHFWYGSWPFLPLFQVEHTHLIRQLAVCLQQQVQLWLWQGMLICFSCISLYCSSMQPLAGYFRCLGQKPSQHCSTASLIWLQLKLGNTLVVNVKCLKLHGAIASISRRLVA